MPLLIPVLALAIFAQGTSEFMLAGLLLPLAVDLGVEPSVAALLTSAFAVGMVVGAPVMALFASRWRPRRALVLLLLVFIAAHVVGALASSFWLLLLSRVLAALANAGFLAIALATVRGIVAPERVTRAVAVLLAGTTLATIVGVPAGAALANAFGWRSTFWAVALLCLPAVIALLLDRTLGATPHPPKIRLRTEVAELRRPPVLLAVVLAVLVNAATFGAFTFLAVIGTDAGMADAWIPLLLAVFGIGAFLGVAATGRWAARVDRAWVSVGAAAATVVGAVRPGGWFCSGCLRRRVRRRDGVVRRRLRIDRAHRRPGHGCARAQWGLCHGGVEPGCRRRTRGRWSRVFECRRARCAVGLGDPHGGGRAAHAAAAAGVIARVVAGCERLDV
ncbi:MFS transporter [Microbacterium sp. Se63.02b]|uniref:MFS transporter n=1 Tax=Microbacterium sp. Se63.02b TaxID=2709304 RepID=UPI001FCE56A3|nr:MFS transporter [Microbacterium sp. Se63.02b]